jgi:pectin methylesterase-like acyl-CoA thioesterase
LNSINVNGRTVTVGRSQNADFTSIIDALNSKGIKASKGDNFTIVLEPGVYTEQNITLAGNVVITGNSPYWGVEEKSDFEFN